MKKILLFTASLFSVLLLGACKMGAKASYVDYTITTNHVLAEEGFEFTKNNIKVIANYTDGTQAKIDGYEIEPALPYTLEAGKNVFTITYKGVSETIEVYKATQATTDEPKVVKTIPNYVYQEGNSSDGPQRTIDLVYVEFGDYASEEVPESNKPASLSETVALNGWYIGSDGKYYGKAGEKLYKVSPMVWRKASDSFEYADGKTGTLLIADKIIAGVPYFETAIDDVRTIDGADVYDNNYKYSVVRAYLNGYDYTNHEGKAISTYKDYGFVNTAFSSSAKTLLKTVTVKNDSDSTNDFSNSGWSRADGSAGNKIDYTCANTSDKAFILSMQEITTYDYGFTSGAVYGSSYVTRIFTATDYAKENGVSANASWVRTPYYKSNSKIRYTNNLGYPYNNTNVNDATVGVVPCVVIAN